jgi:multidrug efflux pump subunit AcrB
VLEGLKLTTSSGTAVPLTTVAEVEFGQGPTSIDRYDRRRRIVLGADLVGDTPLGEAVEAVMALPAAKNLAPGVEIKEFGAAEVMGEVFESFAKAMGAGLMMVYAVLVLLFSSFLQPITILFSLPLSIGGAIVALALTSKPISLPVVIGILMLMGIVTKNAIMLVDFAVEEMRRGVPRTEAIVDAGRKRARPIVMTTIAMIGGMLPSALALDSGGEFRAPMAIAVIGGLISSTVLSLLFVPAVFALMDDIARSLWNLFARFIGPADEPDADERPLAHSAAFAAAHEKRAPEIGGAERPIAAE